LPRRCRPQGLRPVSVQRVTGAFVTLIAAVEAAISFSSQKIHWQRWRRMVTAAAAIFVAALAVSFLDWQAYRKELLADDLRVNFLIPHPNQIGTSELALTFWLSQRRRCLCSCRRLSLLKVASTDFSNNPARNSELCKLLAPHVSRKGNDGNMVSPRTESPPSFDG
jgi:hypothetical protein